MAAVGEDGAAAAQEAWDWRGLITSGGLAAILTHCENAELMGVLSDEHRHVLLGAYLIGGQTVNAKFLWARTDVAFKTTHSDFVALWNAGQSMWAEVNPVATVMAIPHTADVAPLFEALKASLQNKALALLARSYSKVRLDHFATVVGASPENVIASAAGWGWKYDAATSSFELAEKGTEDLRQNAIDLKQLTHVVTLLEK